MYGSNNIRHPFDVRWGYSLGDYALPSTILVT